MLDTFIFTEISFGFNNVRHAVFWFLDTSTSLAIHLKFSRELKEYHELFNQFSIFYMYFQIDPIFKFTYRIDRKFKFWIFVYLTNYWIAEFPRLQIDPTYFTLQISDGRKELNFDKRFN